MKITIKDISRASGFSCSTVSRVLTNKQNVNEETRKKIEKAILELNYRPGILPQQGQPAESGNAVMIIVGDIANQFYVSMMKSMTSVLQESGYMVMLGDSDEKPGREEELLAYAQNHGFAGVIMVTAVETETLKLLLSNRKCPVVLVNRYIRSMDLDVVCIDNYRGGYMAASYLISHGHKRIAHLSGPANSTASADRTRGYLDAMADVGLGNGKGGDVFPGDLRRESGYQFGKRFVQQGLDYTAVFCGNYLMAEGFANALFEEGVYVPEDVSIICFDDSPTMTADPVKFTTLSQDPAVMGENAAHVLLDRLNGSTNEACKIIYPPKISVRESVKTL